MYRKKLSMDEVRFSPQAESALVEYDWPGNIRELENVVHYALIVSRDGCVAVDDLRLIATGGTRSQPADNGGSNASPTALLERIERAVQQLLAREHPDLHGTLERLLVTAAFESNAHNQVHTAHALSISRNELRTLLKRFGLIDTRQTPGTAPARPK